MCFCDPSCSFPDRLLVRAWLAKFASRTCFCGIQTGHVLHTVVWTEPKGVLFVSDRVFWKCLTVYLVQHRLYGIDELIAVGLGAVGPGDVCCSQACAYFARMPDAVYNLFGGLAGCHRSWSWQLLL